MPFVGEIRIFAGNFEPVGWMFCQGQTLPISDYDTLFNLIGTTYGGDGINTFNLPDLRGRVPLHPGTNMGIPYAQAQIDGTETVTLSPNNLPPHSHLVSGPVYMPMLGENPGTLATPDNNYYAITNGTQTYSSAPNGTKRLAPLLVNPSDINTMMTVQPSGNGQPIENMQPYLVVNFIISLFGIFPSA
ncbi:microcystin-dependent protein [Chitinophaga niastensis]|uniref:Microcystin-dependent protein n=1 Tax=Chitinophaga niastensis TaxID=536980 RepID=A0A2P8H9K5_CHINA|nr:tail fiber protein [Chitinophaga niastensis]PSL42898.1 microcystin-dependent protein [Chitinophaga niastensis]